MPRISAKRERFKLREPKVNTRRLWRAGSVSTDTATWNCHGFQQVRGTRLWIWRADKICLQSAAAPGCHVSKASELRVESEPPEDECVSALYEEVPALIDGPCEDHREEAGRWPHRRQHKQGVALEGPTGDIGLQLCPERHGPKASGDGHALANTWKE